MAHFPSPPTTNRANQSPLQFYIKFIYVPLFLLFFFILLTPSILSLSLSSLFLLPLHYYNMSSVSREINGSRPAPLKIHKDSHLIHKASSSSSSSSSTSTSTTTTTTSSHQQQRHHPVIIYTHSPKVIHTQARDFMALVQKLTGLSRSAADDDSSSLPPAPSQSKTSRKHKDDNRATASASDDSSSSSENCSSFGGDVHVSCSSLATVGAISPISLEQLPPLNPFLSEMPLFTPNSSDIFCSSRSFYRYPDPSLFSPSVPNMDNAISPSVMGAPNTYHEY
ncbi:unnamed protein product [Musa banksii]